MRSNYLKQALLAGLAVLMLGCNNAPPDGSSKVDASNDEAAMEAPELPADFVRFYEQFHADSAYQVQHIIWPLKGLPDQADPEIIRKDNYYYAQDDWVVHHELVDPDGEFDHFFAVVDERLIVERIQTIATNLGMERRFAQMDGEWYLIYYAGMNPMQRIKAE